jgi:hypothetical protein
MFTAGDTGELEGAASGHCGPGSLAYHACRMVCVSAFRKLHALQKFFYVSPDLRMLELRMSRAVYNSFFTGFFCLIIQTKSCARNNRLISFRSLCAGYFYDADRIENVASNSSYILW